MQQHIFQNTFFSRTLNQSFNHNVEHFESDENEPALRKWAIAHEKLEPKWYM
jgi:hypothetical protein